MIITKWWILTGGLFLVTNQYVFAQNILSPEFLVETGSSVSMGRETPFWLISNQYGLLTPNKDNEWIKAGVHKTLSPQRKIDFDYALELINRTDGQNLLYLHQAYVRLKLYFIHFQGGCLEEKFGDQDSSLSSGGLLWSGNARPMPKISLMVPYYTPVPYTSGFVTFKGG